MSPGRPDEQRSHGTTGAGGSVGSGCQGAASYCRWAGGDGTGVAAEPHTRHLAGLGDRDVTAAEVGIVAEVFLAVELGVVSSAAPCSIHGVLPAGAARLPEVSPGRTVCLDMEGALRGLELTSTFM